MTHAEGHCLSYGSATPYLPVLDLLRQLCGITDADGPETLPTKVHQCLADTGGALTDGAPYLLQLLGVMEDAERLTTLSPQTLKHRTFATLRQLCVQRSRQQPLVLAVENLHWIDPTSEEWLASLVESLAAMPLLLLTTYRPGYRPLWMDKSYATQLALTPLTPEASRAVVQSVPRTTQLSEPLVQAILTKAAGNPFFLEELARAVVERQPSSPALPVPETVQAVLAARIDRLPAAEKRVLQMASMIGKDIPFSLLRATAERLEAALDQALSHLQMEEFVYAMPSGAEVVYTFKHALTQDVAYQSLLPRTRQQYHGRIAQVLAERFPEAAETQPEVLAHHYTAAGLQAQAVACWQRAGQRATERAAYAEAVSHLRAGLEVLGTLPDTPERTRQELNLQIMLGNALIATKGWGTADVEQVFLRAYDLCHQVEETTQLFSVLNRLCNVYVVGGSVQTAREYGEQLLSLAQCLDDPGCLLISHSSLGEVLSRLGAFVQAREHLEQARALLGSQEGRSHAGAFDRRHGQIRSHTMMTRVLWMLGYPDQALARSQEALIFARDLGHPFVLAIIRNFAAVLHVLRGEWQQVREEAEAVLALATEHGFPQWRASGTVMHGWALAAQGQVEEGIEQMRRGLTAVQVAGSAVARAGWLAWLAGVYGKVGYATEGLQVLNEAQAVAHATGTREYEAELHRLRGELLLVQSRDNHAKAETCFHHALGIAQRQQAKSWELRAATSLSRLWQHQGKDQEARELLAPIYGWFSEGFDTADLQEAKALLDDLGRQSWRRQTRQPDYF